MSEMILRIAKRLASRDFSAPWEEIAPHYQDEYLGGARSAIEAMREPTDAMCDVGNESTGYPVTGIHIATPYQAMIDEALK